VVVPAGLVAAVAAAVVVDEAVAVVVPADPERTDEDSSAIA